MKKTALLLVVVVVFAGLIIFRGYQQKQAQSLVPEEEAVKVEVVSLKKMILSEEVDFSATIEPEEKSAVVPRAPGRTVLQVFVSEGDRVKKGQSLASLDSSIIRQQIEEVRAIYETALADHRRFESLYEDEVVSRQAADQARTRYMQALSAYEQAKIMSGYHTIASPSEGVVAKRLIDPGDTAPQGPAFLIFRQDRVKAVGAVPERYYHAVKEGDRVLLSVDALPGRDLEAEISSISPVIDPATRMAKVEVALPSEGLVMPGMFARVRISAGERESMVLPLEAVSQLAGTGETTCFVASDGLAWLRVVEAGLEQGGYVEITGGLQADEEVIVTRSRSVKDGTRIEVFRR
jgi:RND family efflux transporter MFP subunit